MSGYVSDLDTGPIARPVMCLTCLFSASVATSTEAMFSGIDNAREICRETVDLCWGFESMGKAREHAERHPTHFLVSRWVL